MNFSRHILCLFLTLLTVLFCENAARADMCGNGLIEPTETCDDGNMIDGDGCNTDCQIETPANLGCAARVIGGCELPAIFPP